MPTSGYIYPGAYGYYTGPMDRPYSHDSAVCLARKLIFELVLQLVLELLRLEFDCK